MNDDLSNATLGARDDAGCASLGSWGSLAQAMAAVVDGGGKAAVEKAIAMLRGRIDAVNRDTRSLYRRLVLSPVIEVDRFFMDCIIDDAGCFDLWEGSADSLRKLLCKAEVLLVDSPAIAFKQLAVHKSGFSDDDPIALGQRLNAYLCIAAGFGKDDAEFDKRLSMALCATETNVDRLLSRGDSVELVKMEQIGRYGYYAPKTHYWTEPLALLSYAAVHIGKAREVRRAYELYIKHLELAGADLEGVRGHLMLDAERTLGNLVGESIEEIYPSYPLDFSATDRIRELVADRPEMPIVIFAGPEGTGGAYCDIERVEVVELLNRKTHYYNIANVATSRDELVSAIERDIRDLGCVDEFDEDWTSEQIEQVARKEAAEFDGDWVPAIAIYASWKDI